MTIRRMARLGSLLAVAVAAAACSGGLGQSDADLVASARASLDKRDFATAEIELKGALQKNPQNGQARLLLGRMLLETGNAPGAEIELRRALELGLTADAVHPALAASILAQGKAREVVQQFGAATYPTPTAAAEVKVSLALAHMALGEPDRARDRVSAALAEDPRNLGAKLLQARIVAGGGNIPGALGLVEEILAIEARHLGALLFKGDLLRVGSDRLSARASYAAAAEAHPTAAAAHVALANLALEQNDISAARLTLEAMRKALASHRETVLLDARLSFIDKDHQRVRALTNDLLRLAPNDLRVAELAGINELQLNSLTQAEAYLRQVSTAAPNARRPRLLLATIYNRTAQPTKAIEILRPLLDGPRADPNALTYAGEALIQLGDVAGAEKLFKRAVSVNPEAQVARIVLALGELARGNTTTGMAELEAAASADSSIGGSLALITSRLRINDMPGALRAIGQLEDKHPKSPIPHALRASISLQQRDAAGAASSFEKALKLDPLFFPATAGLASIDFVAGRADAAEARFETLLKSDPRNVRALLSLAELKVRTGGKKDEVTAAVDRAVKAAPNEAAPRVLLVKHLLGHQDTAAALSAAQSAAAVLPSSVEILDMLGAAQLAAGQPQQAISTYARLASLRADRPEPQLRLADAHLANQDLPATKRALERALEIRPGLLEAQRGLVIVAMRAGDPSEALRVAQRVQRAQPRQAIGYVLQADIESARKEPGAEAEALRRAVELEPTTPLAMRLHRTLIAANRPADAERFSARWLRERPRDAGFHAYLGDQALARKEFAGAESHYRTVIEIQPNHVLALNNIAWILAHQKRPGAVGMARKANDLLPDHPGLMDTLAWALAVENQVPKALEVQRQAIAKAPNDHNLRLTLARIYLQGGDKSGARAELQTLSALGDKFAAQAEVKQLLSSL